jgi:sec-independent protein translocase protein TatC
MAEPDLIDRAKTAVSERAELPGMSLMQHLEDLRKCLIRSALALFVGMMVAWCFYSKIENLIARPITQLGLKLTQVHPIDAVDFAVKVALYGGVILASPYILYQVWTFISPGLYRNERRYVVPFMGVTVGLFLTGIAVAYYFVLPSAMPVLLLKFGHNFTQMITIDDYMQFFLAVVLGLGITFELPIVVFFLAIFGIVDAKFMVRHSRYAILLIFIIAAIICPAPDPISMCIFASPMLILYGVSIGVAYVFHPSRRKKKEANA